MKHFVYTLQTVSHRRAGYRVRRCMLWAIVKNTPTFIGSRDFQFESDDQAAVGTLLQFKAISAAQVKKAHRPGSKNENPGKLDLEYAGVCKMHCLSNTD